MTCSGSCCENFPLPFSKEILNRKLQEGVQFNGTPNETKMIAEMVIPIQKEAFKHNGSRYFWYTCKNWDRETRKCTVYEKRPVMCRTYPDTGTRGEHKPVYKCSDMLHNGCSLTCGTPREKAMEEFKKSHGLVKDGNVIRLQQLSPTP